MKHFQQSKRVRFFSGQMLTAKDLQEEQEYFLGRMRRHNRFLHGWGVVSGLEVSLEGKTAIAVEPGLAIDCAGNELVLAERQCLSIEGTAGRRDVVLRYVEIPSDHTPDAQGESQPSRVLEAAAVEVVAAGLGEQGADHKGMGRGTPGCGEAHPVVLATVTKLGSRWRVAAASRGGGRRGTKS